MVNKPKFSIKLKNQQYSICAFWLFAMSHLFFQLGVNTTNNNNINTHIIAFSTGNVDKMIENSTMGRKSNHHHHSLKNTLPLLDHPQWFCTMEFSQIYKRVKSHFHWKFPPNIPPVITSIMNLIGFPHTENKSDC